MEKQSNKNVIIVLLVLIIVILSILCILFATGTINFVTDSTNKEQQNIKNNQTNSINNKEQTGNNIQSKLVNNPICNNSETTFNGIEVKLEQEDNDGVCVVNSITINGKDVKNEVSLWVHSYEIYDNNVIFFTGNTSGSLLTIYNTTNQTSTSYAHYNLNGYNVKSYYTTGNKIVIIGKECGEQCGETTTGYSNATFEIEYSNGMFSQPKLINKSN